MTLDPYYRERQDAQLAKQTKQQIEYSEERNNMARTGRPKAIDSQAANLLAALSFVSVAATKDIRPSDKHLSIGNNFVVASDGQMSAGFPIQEDLNANPDFEKFKAALEKCGKSLAITQLENNRLAIKGDKLRAIVPCLPDAAMLPVLPDPPLAVVDDRLKAAFAVCGSLASEAGTEVIQASLLLEANICSGTNRAAIMQYFHGIDLPPKMVIPKIFTAAICKQSEKLTAFGASFNEGTIEAKSITLYFDGGAWIKTVLYADKWPDINSILDNPSQAIEMPKDLVEAIDIVSKFDDNEFVYIWDGAVSSHRSDEIGANFEIKGFVGQKRIGNKVFKLVAPYIKHIDLVTYPNKIFFFGENMRGCISPVVDGQQ